MKYKKSLIFICLLICLFSIVSVVASDVNETVVASEDQMVIDDENDEVLAVEEQNIEEIGVKEEDYILTSDGTYQDLQKEINNAGDVLNLTKNYTFSYNYNGIKIGKKITINGNGFTINLKDSRGFIINSNDVVLKNIVLLNPSHTENGCAIYWGGDNGIVSNCSFIKCHCFGESSCGGAVYWAGNNGTIENCSFINCSTYNGQMTNNDHFSKGGAIYWSGDDGTLVNSIFSGCYVHLQDSGTYHNGDYYGYGGAVYWAGKNGVLSNFSVNDCRIYHDVPYYSKHNPLYSYGGAVYWEGENGKLSDGNFINCNANANSPHYPNLYSKGGAVYWAGSFGNLNNCSFLNCAANSIINHEFTAIEVDDYYYFYSYSYGGAVYWEGANGILNNSKFNKCISNASYDSLYTHMYISQFDNTYAIYRYGYSYGGAVYWEGASGKISNCSFINSTVDSSSFSYYEFNSKPSTSSRNFNYMYSYGGAVYFAGNNGRIDNSSFINCNVVSISKISSNYNLNYGGSANSFVSCIGSFSSYAGAVYWAGSNGILENNIFKECYSSSNSDYIYATCTRNGYGGAVYWDGGSGKLSMCNFSKCGVKVKSNSNYQPSSGYGGAVYWKGNYGKMSQCIISDCSVYSKNTASYSTSSSGENSYGGAVYWESYGGNIDETSFIKCTVNHGYGSCYYGGAIYWNGNSGTLSNSIFINNTENDKYNGTLTWNGNQGIFYNFTINGYKHSYNNHVRILSNNKLYPQLNVFIPNVYLNETTVITPSIQLNPLGNMTFSVYGGEKYDLLLYEFSNIEYNGTVFNLNLSNISVGTYKIISKYFGDSIFKQSSCVSYFNVIGYNANIKISVENNIVAGDNVLFNVTFDENVSGIVTILINNKVYSSNLNNSKASISVPKIYGGINSYVVKYSGDEKYNSLEITKILNVSFLNATLQLEFENSSFGNIIINPIISKGVTGYIDLYVDNILKKKISVGNKFVLNDIDAGNHTFKVIYEGDNFYDKCENISISEVLKADANFSIILIDLGNGHLIINITMSGEEEGNMTVLINNAPYIAKINNGKANFDIKNLIPNSYCLSFIYSGCQNYNPLSIEQSFDLRLIPTVDVGTDIIAGKNVPLQFILNDDATGNVTIDIDDNKYHGELSDGIFSVIIPKLTGGLHNYLLNYSGDTKYISIFTNQSFNVSLKHSKLIINVNDMNFGESISILPVVFNDMTGNIDIYLDNKYRTTRSVGVGYTLSNLNAGNHTLKLIYSGDNYYESSENSTTFLVNKINTTISVSSTNVIAGNTALSIALNNKATGTITVNVNNKNYTKTLSSGKATVYIYDLPAGNYEYTIHYKGDQNFNQASYKDDLNIQLKESSIVLTSNNIYVDKIAKINYTITSGATGLLSVYVNNEFVKNVTVGKNMELENLPHGNYTVKVIYNSDGYYANCQNTTTFKVQKLNPTFSFTKNNAIAGDDFVITHILNSDATGTITCNNSTKQLTNGRVTFNINNIKGGQHQFNISYSGDDKYNPMNKTVTVNIKFKDAIVDFDVKDIIWSDSLTIAPTLTAGATGYLNIYIDNNLNSTISINGRKDFTFYVGGYHYIKVAYSGDEYYASNSTIKGFNVIKLDSTCNIKGNIEVDNSATVYVTLNEDTTGKVGVYIKGTKYTSNLIGGIATFRVPNLAAGNYSVTIDYEGDSKYNSIYITKSLEVTLKPSTITLNVKNILTGNNLVITPIVTSSASGNLKVYVDNVLKKTIAIGSSYTIEQPTIGSHNIRVVYAGDSYHQGNETKTTFRVFTFYPIEVQNTAIIYGTDKHLQAIFYDEYGDVAANKLVAFSVNGEDTVVMTDINGLAVFNKDLPIGTYTVTVINAYVNEEHDYSLKVFTSIESEDMTRAYNTGMDFKVKLLDENAETLSRGYALFNVNNKDYPVVADNNGIAILNANLPVGTYTVSTTNGRTGETKTNKITIVPSVEASNLIRGYNSGVDFKAKFLDADAKALVNQKVAFKIDNIEYEVTTDANGFAVLNEQLDVGTYEVTAINKVTGEKATRNLTIVDRIVENNDVIRIYGEESYYTIHVVGDDGSFVGENEIINININNIDYQIRTDSNGYASFRIDENIGSYEILAEYKGYEVYNEVYVLQRVNYITNIDVKDISYKQNAIINLNLSTFVNNAFVEFEIIGDTEYDEVFDQLANSYMSLPVSGLNAGKYTVTAKYYDLNTYKFSSMTKTFNVNKINPKVIIVVENANVSETAKITVNVPEVEGDVEIKIGNALTFNEYLVKNGVIIKEINDLPADDYNVYVTYKGDNNYNVFTQSAILTIIQPKELTTIVASDITTTEGVGTYLVATLKDIHGNVLVNKGVSIYFNGLNSILTTDKNGQVRLAIGGNLVPNTYVATISFVGDDYYVESSTVAKVIVNKKPVKTTLTLKKVTIKRSAKKLTIQATLKVNGKAVKGKTIKFKFNKKTYKARTNAKGVAKITVKKSVLKKLKAGKKVKYQATYGKITKKVTVKVKK